MKEEEIRIWEVMCAICGHCVYVKRDLTHQEAKDFISQAIQPDGTMKYVWPDGEMFIAQETTSAVWMRRCYT